MKGVGIVSLRPVIRDDLELMMAWRSVPAVYAGFYLQSKPLTWEEHWKWWKSRTKRMDWIVVLENNDGVRDVGVVNVTGLGNECPSVGIYIGDVTLWGKKVGSRAVGLVINWLSVNGFKEAQADILKDNIASIKMFESVGFRKAGEGRDGEWLYRLILEVNHGRGSIKKNT